MAMVVRQLRHPAGRGVGKLGSDGRPGVLATINGWPKVLATFNADAALDGFSLGWSRVLTWYPAVGTLALGLMYALNHKLYYWFLLEDHPVEWVQFAFLVFACLTAVLAAGRFQRQGRSGPAGLLILAAVGCFGMAGEEISWGQRVFSLTTPTLLKAHNAQGEITVHNMFIGNISFDKISDAMELILALAGCALAVLARPRRAALESTPVWYLAPPLVTVPGFALTTLYWAFMLATDNGSSPAALYKQWAEICLYLGIVLTVTCCYTRAAQGRYVPLPTSRRVSRQLDPSVRVGRMPLIVAAVAASALMGVFAQMSADSGVLPGNVPSSLVSLYGSFPL
jgi:hypothetical protein